MPGQKISTLTPVADLQTADQFVIARSGATYRIEGSKIASKAQLDSLSAISTESFALNTDLTSLSSTIDINFALKSTVTSLSSTIDNNFLRLSGGVLTGPLAVTGNLSATGDIIAYASSDERLKNDIVQITDALDKVSSIRGVFYNWNTELQTTYSGEDIGVIAQEVQKILPIAVVERSDGYKAVKYEKIIPLLIESVKDLKEQIRSLTDTVCTLQNQINNVP